MLENFLIKLFYLGMFVFPWVFIAFMCLLGEKDKKRRAWRQEHSVYGCGIIMKEEMGE